jgi:Caspase domain
MARRALLIGSATYGLTGVQHDVESMAELLRRRGFDDVVTRTGPDAAREPILDALGRLQSVTRAGDAVVLYYSGHGSRIVRPDAALRRQSGTEAHLQFLVPTDIDQTTESAFRGLLSAELTAATRQLTAITNNVTVILDSCHSGAMVRGLDFVPKSVQPPLPVGAGVELADRIAYDLKRHGLEANPLAVRIVACETDRTAYEVARVDGPGRAGLLTTALVQTLTEVGDRRVSWHSVLTRVREQVQAVIQQRPDVEGPSGRVPFGLDELPQQEVLPVRRLRDRVVLEGAALLGLAPGDTLRLQREDDGAELAAGTVGMLVGADAEVELRPEDRDRIERGVGVVAVPLRTSVRRSVAVSLPEPLAAALRTQLEASPRLLPGETGAFARVVLDAEGLVVEDATGARARTSALPPDETGVGGTVALLEQLAAGDRLRNLLSGTGEAALDGSIEVSLHRYVGGDRVPVAPDQPRLHRGDRIGVTVRNQTPHPVSVWLFDVGVSGRISLVSNDLPSGRPLAAAGEAGDAYTFGDPGGLALGWPRDVPDDSARPDTLVVIAADRPADLRALETAGRDARSGVELSSLLAEVRTGVRELEAVRGDSLRYLTKRLDLLLVPSPRPRDDEPPFEIDDTPDFTARLAVPRGVDVPSHLAVQLAEMVIRRNRALFGADVRLDWLVVTNSPEGMPAPVVGTDRFPRVADWDALPLDNMLLYHGPVRDYLELRLWVSRNDRKGADLATLFDARLSDPGMQAALTTLVGVAVAAPAAAVAVGTVAAVATLTRVVAELVAAATGKDIGVYRTCLLARDRFGTGRIPVTGRRQAADVEFALEITDVTP